MRGTVIPNFEQMYKNAWERNVREAEDGVVPTAVSRMRLEAEMHVLAKRQSLTNEQAHEKLVECLRRNNVEWENERYFPRTATIELIREAFA